MVVRAGSDVLGRLVTRNCGRCGVFDYHPLTYSLLTAHYSLLTAHYHYSLLTTQLTTHCSLLTGLVEAAVAEDMHKWDHGSGAQQQRRPQLGLLVSTVGGSS